MDVWKSLGLVLLISSTACTPDVQFSDDLDYRFDLRRVGGADRLATPYVEGAPVQVLITSFRHLGDFDVVSSDPHVFRIQSTTTHDEEIRLTCTAMSAGVAELLVSKPNGTVVGSTVIEVGRPDRAELHSAGAVFAMLGDEESEVVDPFMLEGGRATFEVRWFEGSEQLFGNAALQVSTEGRVRASRNIRLFGEKREWIGVDAQGAGEGLVHLDTIGGRRVDSHSVRIVPAAELDGLELRGDSDADARDGDRITLVGESTDVQGNRIFGAEYAWTHGQLDSGVGDMYRYTFESALEPEVLTAELGDQFATRAVRGIGDVASSNQVGCSSVGTAPYGFLGLIALFAVRRRR